MKTYVGIDYSTRKVAVAMLGFDHEDDRPYPPMIMSYNAPKRLTGMFATKDMLKVFSGWCMEGMALDAHVYIESPIMGRTLNVQTTVGMGIAAGALMQSAIFYGASSVDFVAPSFWKKKVTGNGAMDKVGIGEWLNASQPDLAGYCENEDERDAMCLALLCQQVTGIGELD